MRKAKRAKSKLKLCVFICAEFQLKADKARQGRTRQVATLLRRHLTAGGAAATAGTAA